MALQSRTAAGESIQTGGEVWARRHAGLLAGALLFTGALALRLYHLGTQSLWLDEGGTWAEITGKGWPTLLAELFSKDAAYPLYHLLMKGWVALAGDSEWALRFPSALAGAAAAVAVALAASEARPATDDRPPASGHRPGNNAGPLPQRAARISGMLAALSPFALWYAQDAKVYSLLLLVAALLLWLVLRALRLGGRAWLPALAVAMISVFVHRLALLSLAGMALAVCVTWPWGAGNERGNQGAEKAASQMRSRALRRPLSPPGGPQLIGRAAVGLLALLLAALGIAGTILAVGTESRQAGGHIAAGPALGLWLTVAHYSLNRGNIGGWLSVPLAVWMLPGTLLAGWGIALLARDARRGSAPAAAVLCALAVPLALFAVALAFAPVYEARYTILAFPAWLVAQGVGLRETWRQDGQEARGPGDTERAKTGDQDRDSASFAPAPGLPFRRSWASSLFRRPSSAAPATLLALAVAVDAAVLLQPQHGQFSGAPVKEQWREAITDVARRVHPDDLLILHPYYVQPMWDYYAPRVTPDPLPRPVTFPIFAAGDRGRLVNPTTAQLQEFVRKRYEPFFNQQAEGKARALLLIAPDHARTVDPPPLPGDTYGWLGLRFAYPQKTWPCGGTGEQFIGVEVMCQSFPETFHAGGPGAVPEPAVAFAATFGGELRLRGYTLSLHGGALRPGGALPVTLFWAAARPPTRDYTMFLHLCQDCSAPPLAQDDSPPLGGYPPAGRTTTWRVNDPVHDERAVMLPPDLPPGRYTLLLGVYPLGDPAPEARLPVASTAPTLGGTRLVLGEVEVQRPK
jgi:mannosyltransferase